MAIGLLGRKVGMTQIFDEAGKAIPVTVIQAGPCHVLQVRTADRDGYDAVQLGFRDKPRRLASRADRGQVAKLDSRRSKARSQAGVELLPRADCEPQRFVREFRGAAEGVAVGQQVTVEVFEKIAAVDVIGISKGKGFQGAMKRHNFKGQRATHGVKKVHRHIGGTSGNTFPGRTFKGKKMAGHMGDARTTSRNLKVVRVDKENNLLVIRGAVPGAIGGYVAVRQSNKLR